MKDTLIKAALAIIATIAAAASSPSRAQETDGKALFLKNCAACHQATGKGIPGAFPALAGSKFAQGPGNEVASVLLKWRGGMPDFSDSLSDSDIATVLTFVRSSWGNKADGLNAEQVASLRTTLGVDPFGNSAMSNKH